MSTTPPTFWRWQPRLFPVRFVETPICGFQIPACEPIAEGAEADRLMRSFFQEAAGVLPSSGMRIFDVIENRGAAAGRAVLEFRFGLSAGSKCSEMLAAYTVAVRKFTDSFIAPAVTAESLVAEPSPRLSRTRCGP